MAASWPPCTTELSSTSASNPYSDYIPSQVHRLQTLKLASLFKICSSLYFHALSFSGNRQSANAVVHTLALECSCGLSLASGCQQFRPSIFADCRNGAPLFIARPAQWCGLKRATVCTVFCSSAALTNCTS